MSRGPFKVPPSPKHPERDLLGGHTQAPPRLRQVSLIRAISGENTGAGSLGQVRRGGGRKGGTGDCYPVFGGEGDGKQDGGEKRRACASLFDVRPSDKRKQLGGKN